MTLNFGDVPVPELKTADLERLLQYRHASGYGEWVLAFEIRVGTGWSPDPGTKRRELRAAHEQRIDAYAVNCWPSKRLRRVSYEIKTSRRDLVRELRAPEKRVAAVELSNEFYFVLAAHVHWTRDEIPEEAGVLVVRDDGRALRTAVSAPYRETPPPPWSFTVSLLRNVYERASRPRP